MNETSLPRDPPSSVPDRLRPIASVRHMVTLIVILLAIAAYGVYSQHLAAGQNTARRTPGSAIPLYCALIVAEWALLRFTLVGLRKAGTPVGVILGRRWKGPIDVARDVAIALLVWAAWTLGAGAVDRMLGGESSPDLTGFFPRGAAETALWVILSISAGVCEEVIYRGYLQRQFEALSRSALVGVLGQAIVFGISHGYQGLSNVVVITVYGTFFGLLARWRRSLVPGMLLHAWTDVFGGIFERSF